MASQGLGTAPGGSLHLPLPLAPFVNRRKELQALRPLLLQQRMVTLVGPAGTGKTRLALELAADMRRRFPGGTWFVELAPLTEPALLPRLVAQAVGIAEDGRTEAVPQLLSALAGERALLVLDNCEHLVEPAARLADELLRGCPGLCVLVTSRERLGVDGEMVWRLDPLETPERGRTYGPAELARVDSAMLFADRAWRSHQDFAITPENAADVAELLRRLEGLPLAIELAAAWSSTLAPSEIVARLDDRFELLTARHRTMNSRHVSLRAAIDSSYRALGERERSLFRRLGLFAGGWSLDSMCRVCEFDAGQGLDLLGGLVDRSLIIVLAPVSGPTRYRMLDALREYALEKLRDAGELEAARRRFASHFAQVAEDAAAGLSAADGWSRLELLDLERDNCCAVLEMRPASEPAVVLRLTAALADYWRLRGHYTEARLRLRAVVRRPNERTPDLVRALQALGMMAFLQGDQVEARRATSRALAVSRRIADVGGTLRALEQLARIEYTAGNPAAARAFLGRGLERARDFGDPVILCSYQLLLGQIALAEGRHHDGESMLAEAVELGRRADHIELWTLASGVLGRVYLFSGRAHLAGPLLTTTLAEVRRFGGPRHVAPLLESLAAVAADTGDPDRAARLAGAAASLYEQVSARPPATSPMRAALAARWQAAIATISGRRAYAEGVGMDLVQAVRLALGELDGAEAAPPAASPPGRLTRRQLEIARLVARGLTNREIAARLFISERTAEGHIEQIRNKLGFSSRVQIAAWLVENQRQGEVGRASP